MKRTLAVALAALAVGVAGCGDDEQTTDEGGGGAGQETTPAQTTDTGQAQQGGGGEAKPAGGHTIKLSADPGGQLKFDKSSLTAKAGKVTLLMDNPASIPHAVSIRGQGIDEDGNTVEQGGKSTVSADLKAGEYEFYCPVGGHEQAGMKGTLTVE